MAITIATAGIDGQKVPLNQPRASSSNFRLRGSGAGGRFTSPLMIKVRMHHRISATAMTVVICIIRSALPLDS